MHRPLFTRPLSSSSLYYSSSLPNLPQAMKKSRDIRSFFTGDTSQRDSKRQKTATVTENDNKQNTTASPPNAIVSPDTTKIDDAKEADPEPSKPPSPSELNSYENVAVNAKYLMGESWFHVLEKETKKQSFKSITSLLQKECLKEKIYPPAKDVFAALRDCPFENVKAVILGQDPYHGPNQAHGLSFSVRQGIPPPPSLRNIYKEAISDVQIDRPTHGCLSSWSEQGVLLLNTVLTVKDGKPNVYKKKGWEPFTDAVIRAISLQRDHVVFFLWGKPAQEKLALIDSSKHLVIKSSHPSPLGATKTNMPFIGSKCFSRANTYLTEHGKDAIDWNVK